MSIAPTVGTDGEDRPRRASGGSAVVNISAGVDYAVRALCTLAASDRGLTATELAESQDLPHKFLEGILTELSRSGVVVSHRGIDGGYRLARPAGQIALADVIAPLVETLVQVRGVRPEDVIYLGAPLHLATVWDGLRECVQSELERVTIADIVSGEVPTPDPLTARTG